MPATVSDIESYALTDRSLGTVLIVDDEPMVLKSGEMLLQDLGFHTFAASDAREAIDLFYQNVNKIDLILLDLSMPRIDGLQCLSELRSIKHNIKVIIVSGYDEVEVSRRFSDYGISGFLKKPYTMTMLWGKLQDVLHINL